MGFWTDIWKWQNLTHYALLTFALFGIHYLTDVWGLEALVVQGVSGGWILLFLFYMVGLFVADTIIHGLFRALPKPLKWQD